MSSQFINIQLYCNTLQKTHFCCKNLFIVLFLQMKMIPLYSEINIFWLLFQLLSFCLESIVDPQTYIHTHRSGNNPNRNRKLQTSKAPLKSQAQGTSLFTSAASNQRGFQKNSPWEAQVRLPEGERMRQIRAVFQRIVRGKLRSGCQKVRGGRLGVKAGVV